MKTPWGAMLRAAGHRGVRPDAFWRLSLKEWRMLTEASPAGEPMRRSEFERMAGAWPDD